MTAHERGQALHAFGFTDRQARFLATVMVHAGVCLGRQYCHFAGIARGQVMHDFFRDLVTRGYATAYQRAHGTLHLYHIHGKALYQAVGEPNNRNRRAIPLPRAIERIMVLDAVLGRPDVTWLATERDKVTYFTRSGRLRPRELPHLAFGDDRDVTIRYFPDKLPIGVEPDGRTHVFVYLVTRPTPVDFRAFLHRHAEILRTLARWRLRLLFPPHFEGAVPVYEAAVIDELASPLQATTLDELKWFFQQRRTLDASPAIVADARYQQAQEAFASPRFRVLYRTWLQYGDAALYATLSPVLAEAFARRSGELECVVLPDPYRHLASLVGTA
jgi:hypothetical protein